MNNNLNNIVYLSICLMGLFQLTLTEYTAEDCWSLGLNRANLLCSSCNHLSDFNLEDMKENCKQCCNPDENTNSGKKYAKAVLEVCTCKFGTYPQIQAFVKSDKPKKFPNLRINYVRGLDPIIKLMNDDGEIEDTLAIERWDTDTIEEFLKTHLIDFENDYLRTNQV